MKIRIHLIIIVMLSCIGLCACHSADTPVNERPVDEITKASNEPLADTTTGEADTTVSTEESVQTDKELDPILEKIIRQELGYSDDIELTDEDYESITSLGIFYEDIKSLDGVSRLTNLTSITISGGSISDISELAELRNLTMIDIYGCLVREIPDLSNCKELTDLYLAGNLIEDITPLQSISSLKYANLAFNRISSIEPLKDNTSLESLAIDSNCILDYNTIADNESIIAAIDNGSQGKYETCLETENRAKAVVATFPKDLSELELEKYIYQYVIDNMEYELVYRDSNAFGYYALTEGIGVCGDYAELFCILARHAGLEAYTCESDTHAWNIIVIEGEKYHCDTLWDEGQEEWIYFNQSGEYMQGVPDHSFDERRY